MGTPVGCLGASISCKLALVPAPMPMGVLPLARVLVSKRPMARITDITPFLNIPSFILCNSPANPAVAALRAAALGAPVPGPCVPAPAGPWTPSNPTVLVGKIPVQGMPSLSMCMWAGPDNTMIPGQFQTLA